jgi:DNA-binding MarR family transcriptional regulator
MSDGKGAVPRRRDTVLAAIEAFREEGFPRGFTALILFLYVCENEGITVSELAHIARLPIPMTARVVKMLAGDAQELPLAPERAILELRKSDADRRLKFAHLTARGRALRDRVEAIIADAVPIGARTDPATASRALRLEPRRAVAAGA